VPSRPAIKSTDDAHLGDLHGVSLDPFHFVDGSITVEGTEA
jgi:hypothetical protein